MPPSSNKSVGSTSSNPKKHKKEKKRDKDKSKDKTKDSTADKHHKERKHKEHKEPKESRRSSSGKSSGSKRHRRNSLPRVYWLVLVVVALLLCGVGLYHYKRASRSTQQPAPDTTATTAGTEEGQQEPALPRQRRQKLITFRPLLRRLVHTFERILTQIIEFPLLFPEARATRLRSRALQEMRLNDEPLQDDPPFYSPPGYGPRPRPRVAEGRHLQVQREEHRAALQAIQPVMLNGQEQDCVSPRCLKDGSFPFFRSLENEQWRLVSPKSLCNFILHWGKGELELEAYKENWMRE